MLIFNAENFKRLGKVLLIQAVIFVGILLVIWGSQRLYALVDKVVFPASFPAAESFSEEKTRLGGEKIAPEQRENAKGKALLDAITFQMRRELDSTFGWSANDIIFNKYVLDNRAYRQFGVYIATKAMLDHYSMVIAKLGSNDRESEDLHKARMNHFSINPQKFWFPSAEGSYESGLKLLESYKKDLDTGKSTYNCRSDDIYSAFGLVLGDNVLGYALGQLQQSQTLPFYTLDNRIYEAQGVALVVRDYVKALYTLYPEVCGKNNEENMQVVLHYLDLIAEYDPLYITSTFNSGELIISYLMFVKNRLEDIRDSIRI